MRSVFADPRTDVVFKRIFGTEEHKDLLRALLNDLLELDAPRRIVEVELLPPEQAPVIAVLKRSIVDVKCRDARGVTYVVEMQVLNVEGFEKRVVYNVAKAYVQQLSSGSDYTELHDVVGVTICDFQLWPAEQGEDKATIPMLSHWRMAETHTAAPGLQQLQLVFLELPKLDTTRPPQTLVEKWAYFFREADSLTVVPELLSEYPYVSALEVARAAGFSEQEWDAYIEAGMAIQDERGALTLATRVSRQEGRAEGLSEGMEKGKLEQARAAIRLVLGSRAFVITREDAARLDACTEVETLNRWLTQAIAATSTADALR